VKRSSVKMADVPGGVDGAPLGGKEAPGVRRSTGADAIEATGGAVYQLNELLDVEGLAQDGHAEPVKLASEGWWDDATARSHVPAVMYSKT